MTHKLKYLFLGIVTSLAICSACHDDDDDSLANEPTNSSDTTNVTDTVATVDTVLVREYKDVVYDSRSGNAINIFLPSKLNKENGVILLVHGGSWIEGNKELLTTRAQQFADSGYVAASIDYTLYQFFNTNPAGADSMMNDIMRGLAKIKEMSDEHKWNITKAALYGESAGAHLSLLYAYSHHRTALPIKFVADAVGPIDFHYSTWNFGGTYDSTYAIVMVNGLAHAKYTSETFTSEEAEAKINSISPLWYVDSTSVPTILAYGALDVTQNPKNGKTLSTKLTSYGVKNTLITFANSDHYLKDDPEKLTTFMKKIKAYAKKYFGY